MIVDCNYCEARVDGVFVGMHEDPYDPQSGFPFRAVLLYCPSCKNALLAGQEYIQIGPDESDWDSAARLWPAKIHVAWEIPALVRMSLQEAEKCLGAGAYIASVAMSGRAMEAMCRQHSTKSQYLDGGLKELLDKGVIDNRLYQWGQELRKHRNIAAHASEERVSKDDASDLFAFAMSICDYVYVLNAKFESFMKRKNAASGKQSKSEDAVGGDIR